jgi:hypothetical protein
MTSNENSQGAAPSSKLVEQINDALSRVPDKDWNYSRIILEARVLTTLESPYVLWLEYVDANSKTGKAELTQLKSEITWGSRHSEELGFLEIASLRLNKALLDFTTDESWECSRPVIRTIKKQDLEKQGVIDAFWYRIEEVCGDDFDNR